ncbi:GumC family protein [Oceanibaculum pacificum]|uniref:Polysaccharide chain length determinant N-terminal domain-containing protein n=1 Tax=Oceanibaculum pacificum TaxID=580166 RepID=A0A154W3C0_9PROT|nr:hypothetical protein [Oceanibaculum pacificum]KZD07957.1 hypothetical protein AUP43_09185 [Oceanibaculum pacificum]
MSTLNLIGPDSRNYVASDQTGRQSFTLRDISVLAFYNWRLIVLAFLLVFAIGVAAAWKTETQYTAEGRMLVMISREHAGAQGLGSLVPSVISVDGLKAVESEINILVSPAVIREMVNRLGPTILFPELAERRFFGLLPAYPESDRVGRATEMVRERLSADPASASNIVRITFRHGVPDIASRVINELLEVYLNRRREIYDNSRMALLTTELTRTSAQMERVSNQIEAVKKQYDIVNIEQEVLLAANQIDTVLARQRQTEERGVALRAQIDDTRAKLSATPPRVFDYVETTNNSSNNDDRNILLKLMLQRDQMRQHYQPDYPPLKDIERQIAVVRESMDMQNNPVYTTNREVRNPTHDFLLSHLMQLEIEASAIDKQLLQLDGQLTEAKANAANMREADIQLRELERSRALLETIHRDYTLQSEAVWMEEVAAQNKDASVRISQWAAPPVIGQSRMPSFLAAGLVAGLLFAGAIGFAATRFRQVFILPAEAERRLGMPELASVSDSDPEHALRRAQDSIALLAARLTEVRIDGEALRSLQLTCDMRQRDFLTVNAALAAEVALNHGRTVLVVDLIDQGDGVAGLLGLAEGPTVQVQEIDIAQTTVPGLSVSRNATHSVLSNLRAPLPAIRATLEAMEKEYDMIVLAAPPMHGGPMAQRLAPLVDASILVLEAEETRAMAAMQLRDSMLDVGGDLLGFIFTGRRFYVPRFIYQWL